MIRHLIEIIKLCSLVRQLPFNTHLPIMQCSYIVKISKYNVSQGSQAAVAISCKKLSMWLCVSCKLKSAVPQPGRLLQQPYFATTGFTSPGERSDQFILLIFNLQLIYVHNNGCCFTFYCDK